MKTRLFGTLDVRIDPWQVDYGTELPLPTANDDTIEEDIILDLETPLGNWAPIAPVTPDSIPRLVFVDGVRRLEARLLVRDGDKVVHGGFGSHAVGCVEVAESQATSGVARVDRVVALGAGRLLPDAVSLSPSAIYRPITTADPEPEGPLRAIQEEMRAAEEKLARELSDQAGTLVVADGPLTFQETVRGSAVGYVKRLFRLYLPPGLLQLLAALPLGNRTPLFALRSSRRFARFSWFMRLAPRGIADSDLSGIVRLEVPEVTGLEAARRLADATAALLPRFAPTRARDPRAPQNLLPIGALEGQLRRRLGDARLLRRQIESLIAQEAAHV
jgi:hypothetical protein